MNREHWEKFYKEFDTISPSPFARWCELQGKSIVDLGCGNGRDTYFLGRDNWVIGVDPFAPMEPQFVRRTVEEVLETLQAGDFDTVYCRFFFHAVDERVQGLVLDWVSRNRLTLYAEFRSDMDTPNPDHERRLISGPGFIEELLKRGITLQYYSHNRGLAPYGEEDPCIIRIIAQGGKLI